MTLSDFCDRISGLRLREVDLALALLWFHESIEGAKHVDTATLATELHEYSLTNRVNRTRLANRLALSPWAIKVKENVWKLHAKAKPKLNEEYGDFVLPSGKPKSHVLIPRAIYDRLPRNLNHIADQAEAAFEQWHFDACVVMIRRLVEAMLILAFQKIGHVKEIMVDKDYLPLSGIIGKTNSGQWLRLTRGSADRLNLIKEIGDRGAHHPSYKTVEHDMDVISPKMRVILTELLDACKL